MKNDMLELPELPELSKEVSAQQKKKVSLRKVRIGSGVAVIGIILLFSFLDVFFFPLETPPENVPAFRTYRAPYDFVYNEEKAFEKLEEENAISYHPFFNFNEARYQHRIEKTRKFLDKIIDIQNAENLSHNKKVEKLSELFGRDAPTAPLNELLYLKNFQGISEIIVRIMRNILEKGVISNELKERYTFIRIRHGEEDHMIRTIPLVDIYSMTEAKQEIKKEMSELMTNMEMKVSTPFVTMLADNVGELILPTLDYSRDNETLDPRKQRKNELGLVYYEKGDVLIPKGKLVTPEDKIKIEFCLSERITPWWMRFLVSLVPFLAVGLAFGAYYKKFNPEVFQKKNTFLILTTIFFIFLAFSKTVFLLTDASGYIIPVGMGTFLTAMLIDRRIALVSGFLTGFAIVILNEYSLSVMLFYMISCFLSLFAALRFKKMADLFLFSLLLAALQGFLAACFQIIENQPLSAELMKISVEAVINGLLWNLGILLMPFLEKIFDLTTEFKLLELSDFNTPLMKILLEKAPGTYHHSVSVGNLAGFAADKVKADALLARVGGYYHDVGKLFKPEYFLENINNKTNPHSKLSPHKSIQIIKSHVTEGAKIGKKYGLPEEIIQFIEEHHGTTMMESFFYKFRRDEMNKEISEEFFRYPGKKPQTKESAIVMVADSVEAISRVLPSITEDKAKNIINEVIRNKYLDGQFDECDITSAELAVVARAITQAVIGTDHRRTKYPQVQYARRGNE